MVTSSGSHLLRLNETEHNKLLEIDGKTLARFPRLSSSVDICYYIFPLAKNHEFVFLDIKKCHLFRQMAKVLPAVTGCLGILPWDCLPTLTQKHFSLLRYPGYLLGFNFVKEHKKLTRKKVFFRENIGNHTRVPDFKNKTLF